MVINTFVLDSITSVNVDPGNTDAYYHCITKMMELNVDTL